MLRLSPRPAAGPLLFPRTLMSLPILADPVLVLGSTDSVQLFDAAPVSMWLEDYSGVFELFEQWRKDGVTDLTAFLLAHPEQAAHCSARIRLLHVNPATLALFAADSFTELSSRLNEVLRDETFEAFIRELQQLWDGQSHFQSRSVNYALDGRRLDIQLKGLLLPEQERHGDRVLVVIEDVTELEQARRRARDSARHARSLFQQAPVSLWVEDFSTIRLLLEELRSHGITDLRTFTDVHPEFVERCMAEIKVLDVNQYTLDMFKADSKKELLTRLPDVFREEMIPSFREQLIDLWEGRLFQQREVLNHTLDGSPLNIHLQFSVFGGHEDSWDQVLLALTDITARKKAETYLEYLGKHDVLTKLKNRSYYVDELNRLTRKNILPTSVMVLDLNHLKETNDHLGHISGDALLQRVGEVLLQAVDKPWHAARVGGDEFIVLMPGADEAAAQAVADNIVKLTALNNQFYGTPAIALSIGIATAREPNSLEATLRLADQRMYANKRDYYEKSAQERRQRSTD